MGRIKIILACCLLSHLACGKKGGKQSGAEASGDSGLSTATQSSFTVQAVGDLPKCADFKFSPLVYVIAEEKFYYCEQGAWTNIEIKGAKGDAGTNGVDGAPEKNLVLKINGVVIGRYLGKGASTTNPSFSYYQVLTSKGFLVEIVPETGGLAPHYVDFSEVDCASGAYVAAYYAIGNQVFWSGYEYYYVPRDAKLVAPPRTRGSSAGKFFIGLNRPDRGSCTNAPSGQVTTSVGDLTYDAFKNDPAVTGFTPPVGDVFAGAITIELTDP